MTKAEQMINDYKAKNNTNQTKIIYVKEPNTAIFTISLITTAFFTFGLGLILGKVRR